MKKITSLLIVLVLSMGILVAQTEPQETTTSSDGPQIVFEETEYDFGEITQGDVVEHTFKFKNTGNAPLILNNVLITLIGG